MEKGWANGLHKRARVAACRSIIVNLKGTGMRRQPPWLALLLGTLFVCSGASAMNATLLSRADALREAFASQLDVTGRALNDVMCATALTGLPGQCLDQTAPLWTRAQPANNSIAIVALLQILVADIAKGISAAENAISAIADAVGSAGSVVETVRPDAAPWSAGSASQPTYQGERVSMSPAVHVPAYSSSDEVATAINADVNMLGGLAAKMQDLYAGASVPLIAAAMTGAAIHMPAPSRAPDARMQPWFQGALLPPRNIVFIVDLWTSDRTSGVIRVLQVPALSQRRAARVTRHLVRRSQRNCFGPTSRRWTASV